MVLNLRFCHRGVEWEVVVMVLNLRFCHRGVEWEVVMVLNLMVLPP